MKMFANIVKTACALVLPAVIIMLPMAVAHASSEKTAATTADIGNMALVLLKGGCFKMGSAEEKSLHEVCVSDFAIGKYEVTQGEWQDVMGKNPSRYSSCGSDCPVDQVGWDDIQEFIKKLNARSGKQYRLPTEAEWEYAARSGGKNEIYAGGNDIDAVAWYDKNSGNAPHKVGTKQGNSLGIFDMSGNVWEWVQDCYSADYYKRSPKNNPQGPACSDKRILRGGSWFNNTKDSRATYRLRANPGYSYHFTFGFRLAASSKD
jgi:formylglycine-generating enzyme required for sulfatase activity